MPVRGRTAGNAGQGSKWIRPERRQRIYARDNWACLWCGCQVMSSGDGVVRGVEIRQATLDHVIPRTHGGTNATHNLITACMSCNRDRCDASPLLFAIAQGRGLLGAIDWEAAARTLDRIVAAIERPLP